MKGNNKKFQLVGYLEKFTIRGNTSHIAKRSRRLQVAEQLINEESAKVLKIAVVDKGHKNGNEAHVIYNNGVVKIYNERTGRFITVLIARLPQIERYRINVPAEMKRKIKSHVEKRLNEIEF